MSNTRRANARTRKNNRSRAFYHDCVALQDDYEVVHSREARLLARSSQIMVSERSIGRGQTPWLNNVSWTPEDSTELALDPDGEWYDVEVEAPVMEASSSRSHSAAAGKCKTRSKLSKRPNVHWKRAHRQAYLEELLTYEGRGDAIDQEQCPDCLVRKNSDVGAAEIRCMGCFGTDLVCPSCCVKRHRRLPFHRVERWTGLYFVKTSLKELGLVVQLNHLSMSCSSPEPCHSDLRVLHNNGLHDVAIQYCGCRPLPRHIQLLRRGLYPASQVNVKTCATFQLLRQLHLFGLTTKAGTYDFYRALERLTNNTGIDVPASRYRALLRMSQQWRHLVMLKRAGRGHDPTGVDGTAEGELAILCPTCPHPGINLKEGWETSIQQFLYRPILAMDANFRLKEQLVSSYSQDPGLGTGLSYMAAREGYEAYVLSKASQGDISTCVGFAALAKANTKFSRGLRYTGVAAVSCARGEMVLPCAIGNLVKGERYPNMDYIVASALRFFCTLAVVISYDIACQWFKHFFERMEGWPAALRPSPGLKVTPAIPKLHEPAHKEIHDGLSFNHILGAGLTDGECPERIWAGHNALSNSTKTMGPGSRHDTIDDHVGFWNWVKYSSMGHTLMRKYRAAVRLRNVQVEAHRGFTASMPKGKPGDWEAMCVAWENDLSFPKKARSPFVSDAACLSEAEVRKELAAEDKQRILAGGTAIHKTSAADFILMGLELEGIQRRVRKLAKAGIQPNTPTQDATLAEQRSSLSAKMQNWEQLRGVYMPGLAQLLNDEAQEKRLTAEDPDKPEEAELWLPSQVPPDHRWRVCFEGIPAMEDRFRTAQLNDTLDGLRHVLRLKTRMIQFKNANVRGQRNSTRSRAIIDRVHGRARSYVDQYRAARERKMALSGPGDWEKTFLPLEDSDVRAYTDPTRIGRGPGRRGTVEDDEVAAAAQEGSGVHSEEGEDEGEGMDDDGRPLGEEAPGFSLLTDPRTPRQGTGATRRELSWIWTTSHSSSALDDEDLLRSEWSKSRSRANRATEEVLLLREEMGRLLAFLQWKGGWWREQIGRRGAESRQLQEGLRAYALDQASLQDRLALSFRQVFKGPLQEGMEGLQGIDGMKNSDDNDEDEDEDGDEDNDDGVEQGDEDLGGDEDDGRNLWDEA